MRVRKVGFIDYFLDEWHADNYPRWIAEASAGGWEVAWAWAELHEPPRASPQAPAGRTTAEWCRVNGIASAASAEELIAACDAIVVLSPDHPEHHERLAEPALLSGKPVYVDKTFAPSAAAARRMADLAAACGTPLFSSSALRFAAELAPWQDDRAKSAGSSGAFVAGGGRFENYAVHSFEMLTVLMGTGAMRLKASGSDELTTYVVDYGGRRRGTVMQMEPAPFQAGVSDDRGHTSFMASCSDFFPRLIGQMLAFFEQQASPIPMAETLEIMALLDAAKQARRQHDEWIDV